MEVVIITNELSHHKYFCVELAKRHVIKAIIHPVPEHTALGHNLRRGGARILRRGLAGGRSRLQRLLGRWSGGWDEAGAYRAAELAYFADAVQEYERLRGVDIHRVSGINTEASVRLMEGLQPAVVLNLGGAIYRKRYIDACGLMLNYHSGLSPLYNGAGAVNFPFANGHIHLCGGTLMTMSTIIDGGAILAHYLPSIEPGDTPATLFMKGIKGAVQACDRFLTDIATGQGFCAVPQPPPLFYLRTADWTAAHRARVRKHLRSRLAERFIRPERLVVYWTAASREAASLQLIATLNELMWGVR